MLNLTIIIPIHEYNETVEKYLKNAINSVVNQKRVDELPKLLIVKPKAITFDFNLIEFNDKLVISVIDNNGDTNYQSQVNHAIEYVDTKYFTVLEFDDEISETYLSVVKKHINYLTDVDIFMPMMVEVNTNNEATKLTNETVWSQQFVGENGEMGYLNQQALKQYTDFKLSGAIINKESFIGVGKYKTKIELTFMYEFLLRCLNNTYKIYTIPKTIYKHLMDRKNSLFDKYLNEMPMNERRFWFEVANKEYNFMNDRDIDKSTLINTEK